MSEVRDYGREHWGWQPLPPEEEMAFQTGAVVGTVASIGLRGLPGGSSLPKVMAECRATVGTELL